MTITRTQTDEQIMAKGFKPWDPDHHLFDKDEKVIAKKMQPALKTNGFYGGGLGMQFYKKGKRIEPNGEDMKYLMALIDTLKDTKDFICDGYQNPLIYKKDFYPTKKFEHKSGYILYNLWWSDGIYTDNYVNNIEYAIVRKLSNNATMYYSSGSRKDTHESGGGLLGWGKRTQYVQERDWHHFAETKGFKVP